MKAFLLLADAIRAHQDGTFSLLRGGIDRVISPRTAPIHFRGTLIARIKGSLGETGAHEFLIRFLNEDGQSIQKDIGGRFEVPQEGGSASVVVDFALILPAYGRYTFTLLIDKHVLDTWELRALEAESNTRAES